MFLTLFCIYLTHLGSFEPMGRGITNSLLVFLFSVWKILTVVIAHYQWNFEPNFGWFMPTILIGVIGKGSSDDAGVLVRYYSLCH